ncbi:MAG: ThuA domain-containing protein, partial [Verrucomicrobia bacterium]|nr:ThuA domain-containing protein [Verrucomicrobiota bacterium]
IPTAEKILQKLAGGSKDFSIVSMVQQPDIVVPRKPTPPKPLAEDANDAAKKRFEAETKRFNEAMAAWTPELDAQAVALQKSLTEEITKRLALLSPESLETQKIDGVIFVNTTGDLPLPDREGFVAWVQKGHAFMAMHSASDTFHSFRPYIDLLGGEFETHGSQVPVALESLDPTHPAASSLPKPWPIAQEEMYRIKSYDRARVRDILASATIPMDGKPGQGEKAHFPVSWVRQQGSGRIFYTSLGHREDIWDDDVNLPKRINAPEVSRQFQAHVLGGIRWALGLAEGSAQPQVKAQ